MLFLLQGGGGIGKTTGNLSWLDRERCRWTGGCTKSLLMRERGLKQLSGNSGGLKGEVALYATSWRVVGFRGSGLLVKMHDKLPLNPTYAESDWPERIIMCSTGSTLFQSVGIPCRRVFPGGAVLGWKRKSIGKRGTKIYWLVI